VHLPGAFFIAKENMATGLRRIDNASRAVRTLDYQYPYTKCEYSSGDMIYWAIHYDHDAALSDENWKITKYTWGSDGIDLIETLTGAWDLRGSLDWV